MCGIFAEIAGNHSRDMLRMILARISCFSTALAARIEKTGDMCDDETYRHQCEVRWFIRHSAEREGNGQSYLEQLAKHRGRAAADAFRREAAEQWGRGNKGEKGDWRT